MQKRDYLIILYDYYGELLSEDNRKYFEDYYFDNLSLGEISANNNISRNAVHKHVKSCEEKLLFFEDKLKLYQKDEKLREILNSVNDDKIRKEIEKIFD